MHIPAKLVILNVFWVRCDAQNTLLRGSEYACGHIRARGRYRLRTPTPSAFPRRGRIVTGRSSAINATRISRELRRVCRGLQVPSRKNRERMEDFFRERCPMRLGMFEWIVTAALRHAGKARAIALVAGTGSARLGGTQPALIKPRAAGVPRPRAMSEAAPLISVERQSKCARTQSASGRTRTVTAILGNISVVRIGPRSIWFLPPIQTRFFRAYFLMVAAAADGPPGNGRRAVCVKGGGGKTSPDHGWFASQIKPESYRKLFRASQDHVGTVGRVAYGDRAIDEDCRRKLPGGRHSKRHRTGRNRWLGKTCSRGSSI